MLSAEKTVRTWIRSFSYHWIKEAVSKVTDTASFFVTWAEKYIIVNGLVDQENLGDAIPDSLDSGTAIGNPAYFYLDVRIAA